ncbi:hypothetical protein [Desulfovibrio sp. DV]|uniref:hypothetical protein n=1 Tax=Desulfovibrio sp. DV TaxID=1844708 RepID=UPI0011153606|nr:hypothetical protein [Desulfovibrio sp. DV]
MNWWDVEIFFDECIDTIKENPIKSAAAAGMIAAGTAAFIFAPPLGVAIVAQVGTATASTGTLISTLSGAAATNASLAYLGCGALAAGGSGIAGGTAAITVGGAVLGSSVAGAAVTIAS